MGSESSAIDVSVSWPLARPERGAMLESLDWNVRPGGGYSPLLIQGKSSPISQKSSQSRC
jgi:hypothetical protein